MQESGHCVLGPKFPNKVPDKVVDDHYQKEGASVHKLNQEHLDRAVALSGWGGSVPAELAASLKTSADHSRIAEGLAKQRGAARLLAQQTDPAKVGSAAEARRVDKRVAQATDDPGWTGAALIQQVKDPKAAVDILEGYNDGLEESRKKNRQAAAAACAKKPIRLACFVYPAKEEGMWQQRALLPFEAIDHKKDREIKRKHRKDEFPRHSKASHKRGPPEKTTISVADGEKLDLLAADANATRPPNPDIAPHHLGGGVATHGSRGILTSATFERLGDPAASSSSTQQPAAAAVSGGDPQKIIGDLDLTSGITWRHKPRDKSIVLEQIPKPSFPEGDYEPDERWKTWKKGTTTNSTATGPVADSDQRSSAAPAAPPVPAPTSQPKRRRSSSTPVPAPPRGPNPSAKRRPAPQLNSISGGTTSVPQPPPGRSPYATTAGVPAPKRTPAPTRAGRPY